jgi:tRNA/tmRNA/rRNA uracil-C5-methylase (TrmA/RlmC/RlmD family)
MTIGDTIEITLHDVAASGGVARHEGEVVFVPYTIAGERVRAKIVELRKNFAVGELVEVLAPSPHRVAPRCPYFGPRPSASTGPPPCGGCQYQHIAYAEQLAIKKRQVIATLQRIAGIAEPPVADTIGSPEPFGYRNKISMESHPRRGLIGFHAADHRTLLDIPRCEIAAEPLNQALTTYRAALPPRKQRYSFALRLDSRGMVGSGPQVMEETLAGLTLQVPANSFFQANRHLVGALVEQVRQRVTAAGHRHLLDAYCGVGLFTLTMAAQLDAAIGIEYDRQAVIWARKNSQRLGHQHVRFFDGYVEFQLPRALELLPRENTTLLLDPPRTGLSDNVRNAVCDAALPRLVYVSCDFGTFARDAKSLLGAGYRLAGVQPVDRFPQTAHCEVVGEFIR